MSRNSRRNQNGRGRPAGRSKAHRHATWWWKIGVPAAAVVVALSVVAVKSAEGSHHPTPREHLDHAAHVVPAARYQAYPRVARTYEMVAAVPHVVDGIYCYCHCEEHSGHHSLLDCFASDHAARCDVCLSEAAIAHDMTRNGADLETIRAEIDARYRR